MTDIRNLIGAFAILTATLLAPHAASAQEKIKLGGCPSRNRSPRSSPTSRASSRKKVSRSRSRNSTAARSPCRFCNPAASISF